MSSSTGQTGLELILILAIAVTLGFLFSTYYSSTSPVTIGMVLAKNAVTQKLNSLEVSATVQTINASVANGQMNIVITTKPNSTESLEIANAFDGVSGDQFFCALSLKISQNTDVTGATFIFNGTPKPSALC